MVLAFEFLRKILWRDYSEETFFSIIYKYRNGIFGKFRKENKI